MEDKDLLTLLILFVLGCFAYQIMRNTCRRRLVEGLGQWVGCGPGTYRTGSTIGPFGWGFECRKCPQGEFNPEKNQIAGMDCYKCPEGSTTSGEGATSVDECNVCKGDDWPLVDEDTGFPTGKRGYIHIPGSTPYCQVPDRPLRTRLAKIIKEYYGMINKNGVCDLGTIEMSTESCKKCAEAADQSGLVSGASREKCTKCRRPDHPESRNSQVDECLVGIKEEEYTNNETECRCTTG